MLITESEARLIKEVEHKDKIIAELKKLVADLEKQLKSTDRT